MENSTPSSSRTQRKFIERNRRNQMKALYSMLNSLVPRQSSREANSVPDQIGEATNYIKKLQMNLEKLKEKKGNLVGVIERPEASMSNRGMGKGVHKSPQIEIQQMGSALDVALVTRLDCHFMFKETLGVLRDEGSDIVNASYTVSEDAIYHTIHCQVGECGNGAARISEKLQKLFI